MTDQAAAPPFGRLATGTEARVSGVASDVVGSDGELVHR